MCVVRKLHDMQRLAVCWVWVSKHWAPLVVPVADASGSSHARQVSYSEEGTAADADSLAKQAEHAGRDAGDIGEAAATEQSD
jgi:hypothetical protein